MLKFNGSHIGDITSLISNSVKIDKEHICSLNYNNSEYKIRIYKYKHIITILDEIKKFLNIPIYPKLRCIINHTESFIIKEDSNIVNLKDINYNELVSKSSFVNEIRRLFILKHLMCLTCNHENRIKVQIRKNKTLLDINGATYIPISFRESCYKTNFDAESNNIPKTIIEKWFENNDELVYDMTIEMLKFTDVDKLKDLIKNTVQKYIVLERKTIDKEDPHFNAKIKELDDLVWWSNAVLERIRNYS
jgi:hypothetical protein